MNCYMNSQRGLWDLPHHFDDADGEVNRRSADGTGWTHGHTSLGTCTITFSCTSEIPLSRKQSVWTHGIIFIVQ